MRAIERWLRLAAVASAALLAGCQAPVIPNPNDPSDVGLVEPDVLQRNLQYASDFLNDRVLRGEVTDEQAQAMLAETAAKLIAHVKLADIPKGRMWEYAEVFRTARDWNQALRAYEVALSQPTGADRKINDTLRLAQCLAQLDDVPQAIAKARSVMNASPEDSAPILPAVLLEICPAASGKGHDLALAKLLEDAISKHDGTVVDRTSDAGKSFLLAKRYHIRNAWRKVVQLYQDAGRADLATKAGEAEAAMLARLGSL